MNTLPEYTLALIAAGIITLAAALSYHHSPIYGPYWMEPFHAESIAITDGLLMHRT